LEKNLKLVEKNPNRATGRLIHILRNADVQIGVKGIGEESCSNLVCSKCQISLNFQDDLNAFIKNKDKNVIIDDSVYIMIVEEGE
jgi:hypothetical protein